MMNKKIIAIFSVVTLFASSALPVLADSITLTGNGSNSQNNANVTVTNTTQVQQTNSADIHNNVSSSSNSGENQASHNTGGDVSVETGNASTTTTVANNANSNVANVNNCGCMQTGDVTVSQNGDGSKNTANETLSNQVQVAQANEANISNDVNAKSNSGENGASHNTGGTVSVSTGDATTKVDLSTNANQNIAQVGAASTDGGANPTTVLINGNGSDTHNTVNLGLTDWVVLGQTNSADVSNDVSAKSNTGKNKADENTGGNVLGGDVTIDTGNAKTDVSADTAVNFNEATLGCDCLTGVTAKIAGNGASDEWGNGTNSTINASLTNGQEIGQANGGEGINNDLTGNSKSGDNKTSLNTGATTDPSIMTGDSSSNTDVSNQGNANVVGPSDVNPFPWNWNNSNVTVTFSLQQLLSALGL